jgi:DNA-binding IclR family transcriptional regulator
MDLLSYIAEHGEQPLGAAALGRATGLSRSTCHAILSTLVRHGLVIRHPNHGTFTLGPMLESWASTASPLSSIAVEAAAAGAARLSAELGVWCTAVRVSGDDLVVMARWDPPDAGAPPPQVPHAGRRYPFCPPFGTLPAAFGTESEARRWLDRIAEDSPLQRADYEARLDSIRRRGYEVQLESDVRVRLRAAIDALDRGLGRKHVEKALLAGPLREDRASEEDGDGPVAVHIIETAVFDNRGRRVVSLGLSGFPGLLERAQIERYAQSLIVVARHASEQVELRQSLAC